MEDYKTYYCKKCKEYFVINIIPKITKGAFSYTDISFKCPKCNRVAEETTEPKEEDYK